jgi:hypothetical protein
VASFADQAALKRAIASSEALYRYFAQVAAQLDQQEHSSR